MRPQLLRIIYLYILDIKLAMVSMILNCLVAFRCYLSCKIFLLKIFLFIYLFFYVLFAYKQWKWRVYTHAITTLETQLRWILFESTRENVYNWTCVCCICLRTVQSAGKKFIFEMVNTYLYCTPTKSPHVSLKMVLYVLLINFLLICKWLFPFCCARP